MIEFVIASEAKQSMGAKNGLLRRFAPRNDDSVTGLFNGPKT